MWVFLNDAFLSVVQDNADGDRVLVRSRDLEGMRRVLPEADIQEDLAADYRFRVFMPKAEWAAVLAREVERIDYGNFKNSIKNPKRHDTAMRVWKVMVEAYGAYGRPASE